MPKIVEAEAAEMGTEIVQYTPQITHTPEQIKAVLENTYAVLNEFMRDDIDYMEVRKKKSLTQAGAERLMRFFGLGEETVCVKENEEWPNDDNPQGFLYYQYITRVHKLGCYEVVATGEGTANSREIKYKSQSVYDLVHTLRSMARKRAFTAAVRRATGTSEFWSDSLEDLPREMIQSQPEPKPALRTPMMEPDTPDDVVMPWGNKHKGETLGDIMNEDPTYLQWLGRALQTKLEKGELPEDQMGLKSAVDTILESDRRDAPDGCTH